jgi:RNA polymerase sigma factor (sigma-70 family)
MADRSEGVSPELAQLLGDPDAGRRDQAWATLVATHSRLLVNVARSVASEHDGVMDAYTYVLERLREDDCRRLRGYVADGRSTFTTWLAVVARRLCVDHYRRRYGRAPRGESDPHHAREERASRRRLMELAPAAVDLSALADAALVPDAALQVTQRDDVLAGGVGALDPEDQLLLKLRFEDDLSAREIAIVLRLPSAFHVYRRLAVVCGSLRRWLVGRGIENSVP